MRHVDDRPALGRQRAHDPVQRRDFLGRKGAGWLVENHHLRVEGDRLGNLDQLLLRNVEASHLFVQVELDLELIQRGFGDAVDFLTSNITHAQKTPLGPPAEQDVLGYGQPRHQAHLLIHGGNTFGEGVGWAVEADRLTVDLDRAAVRLHRTAQDLDQCRFPGAVFAQESPHFSPFEREIQVIQGFDAGILFTDVLQS